MLQIWSGTEHNRNDPMIVGLRRLRLFPRLSYHRQGGPMPTLLLFACFSTTWLRRQYGFGCGFVEQPQIRNCSESMKPGCSHGRMELSVHRPLEALSIAQNHSCCWPVPLMSRNTQVTRAAMTTRKTVCGSETFHRETTSRDYGLILLLQCRYHFSLCARVNRSLRLVTEWLTL
jgi:hypothetical protein